MPILTYEQKKEILLENLVYKHCLMKNEPISKDLSLKDYFQERLMDWTVPSYMAKDEIFEIVKPLILVDYENYSGKRLAITHPSALSTSIELNKKLGVAGDGTYKRDDEWELR
jgi:hypothetical protein